MSRIGKQPVLLPRGVEITRNNGVVQVKGPKGTLQRALPAAMELKVEEGRAEVLRPSDSKEHRSLHGLTRTLVANMVQGVTKGYERRLALVGVGLVGASGTVSGILWLVSHVWYLIGFPNRLVWVIRCMISFFTRGRGARLITAPAVTGGPGGAPRKPLG